MSEQNAPQSAPAPVVGTGEIAAQVAQESGLRQPMTQEQTQDAVELQAEVTQAVEEGATKEEIQKLVETFKYKANGKDYEETIDWGNKDAIRKKLELAAAAQPAMQKAAQYEKAYQAEVERLRSNPWEVLKELGLDPDDLAESRIQQKIDELQKAPEQLAHEKMVAEFEAAKKELEHYKREQEEAKQTREQKHWVETFEKEINETLKATTTLPNTRYVKKRVADIMFNAMSLGFYEVTPKDVIPTVEKEIREELMEYFDGAPDQMLEALVGQKTVDRLKKQRMAQMPPKTTASIKDTGSDKRSAAPQEKLKLNDFLKNGWGKKQALRLDNTLRLIVYYAKQLDFMLNGRVYTSPFNN